MPAASCVPASNFSGTGAHTAPSCVTDEIISPPVRNGGMASSRSSLPHSTPTPKVPSALCAENAKKSAPSFRTSTGRCGTDCAPSTTMKPSCACTRSAMASMGFSMPRTFDTWAAATILVRGPIFASSSSSPITPSSSGNRYTRRAPAARHACCQGMRFEWCSMMVMHTSSPGSSTVGANAFATRFRASLALRQNTTSRLYRLSVASTDRR